MRSWLTAGVSGCAIGAAVTAAVMVAARPAPAAAPAARAEAHARRATPPGGGWGAAMRGDAPARGAETAALPVEGAPSQPAAAPGAAIAASTEAGGAPPSYERLLATTRTLQARIAQLERKASGATPSPMTYDLSPAELQTMAANCELRWDMPSLTVNPPRIPADEVRLLALSEAERATIDRLFAASHRRIVDEVRQAYAALTGDDNTGSMSPEAMYAEIIDKIPEAEIQAIFQRIARERAGQATPPTAPPSPAEKLLRTLTGAGDRLEDDLGAALDPQLARSLRDMNGGWQSKFSSTHGCPR